MTGHIDLVNHRIKDKPNAPDQRDSHLAFDLPRYYQVRARVVFVTHDNIAKDCHKLQIIANSHSGTPCPSPHRPS
jgi:hypothetical protein